MADRAGVPYSLEMELAGQPMGANERRRAHWSAQYRDTKAFRDAVALLARAQYTGPPLERAHVVVTLIRRRGQVPLDVDNAYCRAKPVVDGLVVAGLLEGDSPNHITLEVRQEQGRARATRLRIQEVLDDNATRDG